MTFLQALKRTGSLHPMTIGGVRPVIWTGIKSIGDYTPLAGSNVNTALNKAGTGGLQGSDAGPQGDTGKQPLVVTVNGKDAMSFDGGDELPLTYTYGSESTWFIVYEVTGGNHYVISGDSQASHPSFLTGFGADFHLTIQDEVGGVSAYNRVLAAIGTASAGLHVCAVSHKDGGTIKGYFDGVEKWNEASPAGVTLAGNKFNTLGGTTIGPLYTGRLPEFVVYAKDFSTIDMLEMSKYLKNEWATP